MFQKMKNIDIAFRYIRSFTLVVILSCASVCCGVSYWCIRLVSQQRDKVYVLSHGQAFSAHLSGRQENLEVEARDHLSNFHHYFFTLDPDERAIQENLSKALYLADQSAKQVYDNLSEQGYYSDLIAANVNQVIRIDSIRLDMDTYPYRFSLYATQQIIRPTSQTTRSLVTRGALRQVSRSEHNAHGFLIERWETLQNVDLVTKNRK